MTKFNEAQQAFVEKLIRFKGDDPDDGFDIDGNVWGSVVGDVRGHIWGDVRGDVEGNILGKVFGTVGKGQDDE